MTTPPDPLPSDPVLAAQALEKAMAVFTVQMGEQIGELRKYGHRNRTMIWGTIIAGVIVLLLMTGLGLVALQARHAAAAAARSTEIQWLACETGNQTRAAQVHLWSVVLELSAQANPNPTPAEQARITQFRAFIARTFALRDCVALTQGR